VPSRDLPLDVAAGDGRTLIVRLVAWDTPSRVTDDGRTFYREAFARSGLKPGAGAVLGLLEGDPGTHRGPPVARLEATEDRADGLYGRVRVADTSAGRDLLALISEQIVDGISVEFDDTMPAPRMGQLVTRSTAELVGFVFTRAPQHASSRVLAVRSQQETETMPLEHDLDPEPPIDDDPAPDDEPTPDDDAPTTVRRSAPVPRPDLAPARHPAGRARPAPAPARSYRSFGEAISAAAHDLGAAADVVRHLRAWTDELASDVPGLMPHTYTRRVVSIMGAAAPTLALFSSTPLPADGEYMHLAVVKQSPDFAKLGAEKTEIPSRKMLVDDLPVRINAYGGGFDLGWFAWRRSSPATIDVAMAEWAKVAAVELEIEATGLLLAGAPAPSVPISAADPNAGFVAAAKQLLTTTFRWPEVCVLGVDLWEELALATGSDGRPLFPHLSPANPIGRADIVTGEGEVRGLTFAVSPAMTPGEGVLGVREAFISSVGPRTTLEVDVPRLAGRDVAVLMEGAMTVTDGRGLVKLTSAAAAAASAKSKS